MTNANGSSPPDGRPLRIEVRDVHKSYQLGELFTLSNTVHSVAGWVRRRPRDKSRFEAVAGISFEVAAGERFAILGVNGSGKSTLARLIAGITTPTAGEIITRGHVLPMFAVKAGFVGELTARENVTMLGSLLGLPRGLTRDALPSIQAFSEIDDEHLETPVKRFSGGEGTRLGFAAALCLPADVYLFDEVLNAADDAFKERCVAKILSFSEQGKSVIFISHELALVKAVCTRGIWIDGGKVRMAGPIDEIANAYGEYTDARARAGDPNVQRLH